MANNISIKDGSGASVTVATLESGGVHTTQHAASGNVAHDAADSGNPIKIGGKASSSAPTAVTAADRVDAYFDLNGRQFVTADSSAPLPVIGAVAHDAADSGAQIKIGGKVSITPPTAVAAADRADAWLDPQGRQVVQADVAGQHYTRQTAFSSADASGADAAVTAVPSSGKVLVVQRLIISTNTTMNLTFKAGSGGTTLLVIYVLANTPVIIPLGSIGTVDLALYVRASVAGEIRATAWTTEY